MEFLKASHPQDSLFSPKPSIQFSSNINSHRFRKSHFKPYPSLPRFRISAHFSRRPSPRRNSLREKLAIEVPTLLPNDDTQSNLASSSVEGVILNPIDSQAGSIGRGDSVLWNKLEGWVEQYKKDIEFWGLGSAPIFTVYQDLDGNVTRVLVDEDEVVRRSGFMPSESGGEKALSEASSRLSHARFVAKEMETGNSNVLPKNSSVTKFVVFEDSSRLRSGLMGSDLAPNVSRFGDVPQRLVSGIRNGLMRPDLVPNVSRFGVVSLCGLLLVWAVKKFVSKGEGERELTRMEKEMLRRKMKSRRKTETWRDGSVEVLPELVVPAAELVERPNLDKEELMNSIRAAVQSNDQMKVLDVASTMETDSVDFENRIQEIREMATHAREAEKQKHSSNGEPVIEVKGIDTPDSIKSEGSAKAEDTDSIINMETEKCMDTDVAEVATDTVLGEREDHLLLTPSTSGSGASKVENISHLEKEDSQGNLKVSGGNYSGASLGQSSFSKETSRKKPRVIRSVTEAREYLSDKQKTQVSSDHVQENDFHDSNNAFAEVGDNTRTAGDHMSDKLGYERLASDTSGLCSPSNTIPSKSDNGEKHSSSHHGINGLNGKSLNISVTPVPSASAHDLVKTEGSDVDSKKGSKEEEISDPVMPAKSVGASEPVVSTEAPYDSSLKEDNCLRTEINGVNIDAHCSASQSTTAKKSSYHEDADLNPRQSSDHKKKKPDIVKPASFGVSDAVPAVNAFDGSGLKEKHPLTLELDNHNSCDESEAANEVVTSEDLKVFEDYDNNLNIEPSSVKNNWLEKNFDELKPILEKMGSGFTDNYTVVREKLKQQELDQGSDFTQVLSALNGNTELEWMNDDKLRKIVFKVRDNELAGQDPFHSMDEEDKVTFFKSLEEKVEKENEKLSTLHEWLHSNIENLDYGADGISVYDPPEKIIPRWKGAPFEKIREFLANSPKGQEALDEETELPNQENFPMKLEAPSNTVKPLTKVANKSKTVIESSDGSVKPGKRFGKEQWQHTKKHSRGFLESYNAENDPEIKEVMRNMGKDLDRWITEDEIKKASNIMGKLPPRRKAFVEKKLNKVKSEVERFGTQAVLNKYREYAVEEEEDHLWWLDLPYVLGIELYTHEGDEMKVGLYTLEMAADLELDPKPYHVIAFEDPTECKNLCYIINSHLEMLGNNDKAFVVDQPPKNAFKDAKENGFGVTVIRKGQLELNVDQPLEEVEELICEIGSKMYHDKITKERSVDIRSVMKGVLATSKPAKRKNGKRRRLRKPKD